VFGVCGLLVFCFLVCDVVNVLLLSLLVKLIFCNKHFPVTSLGLDLFSFAHLNDFAVLWCPVTVNGAI
jgi:hypothetical protein